jgi:hypothetical protein
MQSLFLPPAVLAIVVGRPGPGWVLLEKPQGSLGQDANEEHTADQPRKKERNIIHISPLEETDTSP